MTVFKSSKRSVLPVESIIETDVVNNGNDLMVRSRDCWSLQMETKASLSINFVRKLFADHTRRSAEKQSISDFVVDFGKCGI